jgi:hypothetical protein
MSLGLIRPGEMVGQMVTPGTLLIVEAKKVFFVYTASKTAVRFGGPADLLGYSILFLAPPGSDPNLNSDLMQVSMAGTNPKIMVPSVNRFEPQPTGAIMATRRTSRSGHELVYQTPGSRLRELPLRAAFDFGAFAADDQSWAACERPSLGDQWGMVVAGIAGKQVRRTYPLPEGKRPVKLLWQAHKLYARTGTGQFSLDVTKPDAVWEKAPYYLAVEDDSLLLNKSESLEVKNVAGAAVVSRVWFTGDERQIATIPGFAFKTVRLIQNHWAFITGDKGGKLAAYLVEVSTGLTMECISGAYPDIRSYAQPSGARQVLTPTK